MAFYAGVGTSRQFQDSYTAGHSAATRAKERSGAAQCDLAVVFAASSYDHVEMLRGINEALPGTSVIGCTSAGAITAEGVEEQAVSVLVLKSDEGKFSPVKVETISKDMQAAGEAFGKQITAIDPSAKLAVMFIDALSGNGTELVRGVLSVTGADFRLTGGAAGDDMNFKQTFQFFNDEVLTDAVVGFGISGEMLIAAGADHGWSPIGAPHVVTKAKGTRLIELDGRPAFSIYEDYFGDRAERFKKALSIEAVSYPLGMRAGGVDQYMIRVPLKVEDDGSIVLGAEVMKGSEIYLMIGSMEDVLSAAQATAQFVMDKVHPVKRKVVFVSNCVARKILLGSRGNEEIELLKAVGGPNTEIFGFYSYGQIAPLKQPPRSIATCDPGFYEQSISITVFGA